MNLWLIGSLLKCGLRHERSSAWASLEASALMPSFKALFKPPWEILRIKLKVPGAGCSTASAFLAHPAHNAPPC